MNRVASTIVAVAVDARAALSAALGPASTEEGRPAGFRGRHRASRR